eukprot:g2673.t1 g2673   contig12:585405-586623(-)
MVRQLLFPKEGGGFLRRFIGIRLRLYKDAWSDDRPLRGPMSLFDFRQRDDAADLRSSIHAKRRGVFPGWRVSDDSVIGGFSTSKMEFIDESQAIEDDRTREGSTSATVILRWRFAVVLTGEHTLSIYMLRQCFLRTCTKDLSLGVEGGSTIRPRPIANEDSTAAASTSEKASEIKTVPDEPSQSLDVRDYLKSRQNRVASIDPSLNPKSGFPPVGFQRLILPFRDFALTSRGRMRQTQRDLDGAVNIESIGFTLMDGKDGDFTFDLVSLRAVNVLEGDVIGNLEDEAREEMIKQQFLEEAGKGERKDDDKDEDDFKEEASEKSAGTK